MWLDWIHAWYSSHIGNPYEIIVSCSRAELNSLFAFSRTQAPGCLTVLQLDGIVLQTVGYDEYAMPTSLGKLWLFVSMLRIKAAHVVNDSAAIP